MRGRLRVSASLPFGTMFVAPSIPAFLQRHPDVVVDLSLTDEVVDLVAQRTDIAIRDEAAWKDFWFSLRERGGGVLTPRQPAVDFEKSMVIVAAMPTQSCLSKVTIRGISHPPGVLVVDLLEEPSAPNCRCLVAQRPLHAVAVPRSEDRVRFVVTQGVTACGG